MPDELIQCKWASDHGIELFVRRFDKLHSCAGGNKLFKLTYWLKDHQKDKPIISFGGAWSNHLLALAAVGNELGINTIGIIRGESPSALNERLKKMKSLGMRLHFISRQEYRQKSAPDFTNKLIKEFGDCLIIPEGGAGEKGVKGASEMVRYIENYDYIALPAGTGTTAAGIAMKSISSKTKIIAFQVLKGNGIIENELIRSSNIHLRDLQNLSVVDRFHFGGYARSDHQLERFKAEWEDETKINMDIVYGAKALFGLFALAKEQYFKTNSRVLYIHTGGLSPQ